MTVSTEIPLMSIYLEQRGRNSCILAVLPCKSPKKKLYAPPYKHRRGYHPLHIYMHIYIHTCVYIHICICICLYIYIWPFMSFHVDLGESVGAPIWRPSRRADGARAWSRRHRGALLGFAKSWVPRIRILKPTPRRRGTHVYAYIYM